MRNKPFYIITAFIASLLLHAGMVIWWTSRPVVAPAALGVAPAVTVNLLDAPSVSAPPPEALPTLQEPVRQKQPDADIAEIRKTAKKTPPPRPQPRPVNKPAPTVAEPAVTSAPADVPVNTPRAAPPATAARYDADYLDNPAPAYPPLSRRLGEEGKVVLRVQVSAAGKPLSVKVQKSSGITRLDKAAQAAVEKWRFVPSRQGEQAITSWVDVPIQFSLKQ